MMEYLVGNFQSYAEAYIRVLLELYLIMDVVLLIYWIKPFVVRRRAVYISAAVYYAIRLICNHAGTTKDMDRILTIGFLILSIIVAWLLDDRRNPVQTIFLFFVFRLISWLSIELFSEVGFWERDFIFKFDWYKYSIEATIAEFFIWNPLQYALALLLLYIVIERLAEDGKTKELADYVRELGENIERLQPSIKDSHFMTYNSRFMTWG